MPTKQDLERKANGMKKLVDQPMTEVCNIVSLCGDADWRIRGAQNDISVMIARKTQLQASNREGLTALERSRLQQERTLALRRQDYAEVEEIEAKLEEGNKPSTSPVKTHDTAADLLTKVNERNRKANVEAVRRAELAEVERKRRERKLASRTPADPNARLKAVFNASTRYFRCRDWEIIC